MLRDDIERLEDSINVLKKDYLFLENLLNSTNNETKKAEIAQEMMIIKNKIRQIQVELQDRLDELKLEEYEAQI